MLSRHRSKVHDLFDDQLGILEAAKLIDVEAVRKLHRPAKCRARLVERDSVNRVATATRLDSHLQVLFADGTLFDDGKYPGKHGLRKPGAPGPAVTKQTREPEVQRIGRQFPVGQNCPAEIGVGIALSQCQAGDFRESIEILLLQVQTRCHRVAAKAPNQARLH